MAGLGPFERLPRIAVAVSGGPDSLSLALLCHHWANTRGGEAIVLSVDHALRAESASEIRQVARWMKGRGIAHRALRWQRPAGRPTSALQAVARAARYGLMTEWCRRHGVLHLALAHHAGDQAETILMRLARGGGPDGLAGMSAVASRDGVRLIRPLLLLAPARLRASLEVAGQDWIEDPSNRDPAFERVRWRRLIAPTLFADLAGAAAEIGRERCLRERAVADLLALARIDPAGFLSMPLAGLQSAEAGVAERALGRCLVAIGGEPYGPSQEALARLRLGLVINGAARTLGGCRIVVGEERLFVFREVAAAQQRAAAGMGVPIRWDGRFDLLPGRSGMIARLGPVGWAKLSQARRPRSMPRDAALALPALWRAGRPAVLALSGAGAVPEGGIGSARFRPGQPLAPCGFTVAKLNVNII